MFIVQSKTWRSFGLLLGLLSVCIPAQAAGSAASTLMSQAMLSMMDAMGNLAQDFSRNRGSSGSYTQPFSNWQGMTSAPLSMYAMPGSGIPGQQQIQGFMNQAPAAASGAQQSMQGMLQQSPNQASDSAQTSGQSGGSTNAITAPGQQTYVPGQSSLDGIWQGRGGEIVLVMYGHFRIYADAENYRDGLYQIRDSRLILYDPQTGSQRSYEFALDEGRMVLRGDDDQLLLYRQLPIPVPPYSTFTGQGYISPQQQSATNQ
jgi:hypothetical protein